MDDQPVTKKDLAQALAQALADTKQEILERTQEMIRDSQTEILRGFEAYAKTSEARLRRLERAVYSRCTPTTLP
jgi:DNA-binding Lrp family transcriptional regulator